MSLWKPLQTFNIKPLLQMLQCLYVSNFICLKGTRFPGYKLEICLFIVQVYLQDSIAYWGLIKLQVNNENILMSTTMNWKRIYFTAEVLSVTIYYYINCCVLKWIATVDQVPIVALNVRCACLIGGDLWLHIKEESLWRYIKEESQWWYLTKNSS